MKTDARLHHITNKFYKSESDRLKLIHKNKLYMEQMINAIGDHIQNLYFKKILFQIFFMDFSTNKPTLHAGLYICCDANKAPSSKTRKELEDKIVTNTPFKKIIWEI